MLMQAFSLFCENEEASTSRVKHIAQKLIKLFNAILSENSTYKNNINVCFLP